jgi:hypothetical protein
MQLTERRRNMAKCAKYGTRLLGAKCQFYQFGFNDSNSCWLDGKWITVTPERYAAEKDAWEAKHLGILAQVCDQHHRNPPTTVTQMTPEQKTAWELNSGSAVLQGLRITSGSVGTYKTPFGIGLAAGEPSESDIRWMRKHGYRAIKGQEEGLTFPPDLVVEAEAKT